MKALCQKSNFNFSNKLSPLTSFFLVGSDTHILLMKQDLIHIFPNAPKAGQPNQAR